VVDLTSRLLFLRWATLIPWGIAGLAVGAISSDRREAEVTGALSGFALGFKCMAAGYADADPHATPVVGHNQRCSAD
jgi:hypothetical protein